MKHIVEMYGWDELWQQEMVWARAQAFGYRFLMPQAFGSEYHGLSELPTLSSETTKFRLMVLMEPHEEMEFWEQMATAADELGEFMTHQECMSIIYQMEMDMQEPWMTETEALELSHGLRTYSEIVGTGDRL